MIKIDPSILRNLEAASSVDDLKEFVQRAIELEHATIPPYLTASKQVLVIGIIIFGNGIRLP